MLVMAVLVVVVLVPELDAPVLVLPENMVIRKRGLWRQQWCSEWCQEVVSQERNCNPICSSPRPDQVS